MIVTTLKTPPLSQSGLRETRSGPRVIGSQEVQSGHVDDLTYSVPEANPQARLALRTRANSNNSSYRDKFANTILEIAGPKAQGSILKFLENDREKPSRGAISEAVNLLTQLNLPVGVQERAASRILFRLCDADQSFVPKVLKDLASSPNLSKVSRENFQQAKHLTTTMGGDLARETLLTNLSDCGDEQLNPRRSLRSVRESKNPFEATRLPGVAVSLATAGLVLSGMTTPIIGGLVILGGLVIPEVGGILHRDGRQKEPPGSSIYP